MSKDVEEVKEEVAKTIVKLGDQGQDIQTTIKRVEDLRVLMLLLVNK